MRSRHSMPELSRKPIVLASQSPRRRALLAPFFKLKIVNPNIDEVRNRAESPKVYVRRMALEKWQAAQRFLPKPSIVVAADTIVYLGDSLFGKARDAEQARQFLRQLSGRQHCVTTAIAVGLSTGRPRIKLVTARVKFRSLTSLEIMRYSTANEWRGKAGAYAIQGSAAAFVKEIRGSLTSIIGLPLAEALSYIEHFSRHQMTLKMTRI